MAYWDPFSSSIYEDGIDDELVFNSAAISQFDEFKHSNGDYLNQLYSKTKLTYETFVLTFDKKFDDIAKNTEYCELANKLGFGMLMRHALETISAYLIHENDIALELDATVFDRLTALNSKGNFSYDSNKHHILLQALDMTNDIAHPHVISKGEVTFDALVGFYQNTFKPLLESHFFSIPLKRSIRKKKKMMDKYLKELKACMDNFNISHKITHVLLKGCLIRHLTECTVNYYSYTNNIVPTDASTQENQISIGGNLTILSQIAKGTKVCPENANLISTHKTSWLFSLKNFSNSLMHESAFKSNVFKHLNKELAKLYYNVITICSPSIISNTYDNVYPIYKRITITTLLCGFGGLLGLHHFYAGNIKKGILFVFFNGVLRLPFFEGIKFVSWIIGVICFFASLAPIFSLSFLHEGQFYSEKWGVFPKTKLTSILAVIFIILHCLGILLSLIF